jgi:hypothetical protein
VRILDELLVVLELQLDFLYDFRLSMMVVV